MPEQILIVEDEKAIAAFVQTALEREGFAVQAVYDGEAALARIGADPPDLILLDLKLSGMDGLEVCRQVRRSEPSISVVMLIIKSDEVDKVVVGQSPSPCYGTLRTVLGSEPRLMSSDMLHKLREGRRVVTNTWRKLKQLIHDGRERVQREGWRQAGQWLAQAVMSLPYSHVEYIVFTRSLLEPLPVAEPHLSVTLRLATETDLVHFRGLVSPSRLHHFKRRLAHGRYCFIALDGEHLAAYCWATTQVDFDVDNLKMSLQPGDAYLNHDYTIPTYRRQGIQTAVHLYRLEYVRHLGCQRAVLIVEDENRASQRLVRKLGYQEADCLSFRRVFWKRIYHYRSGGF